MIINHDNNHTQSSRKRVMELELHASSSIAIAFYCDAGCCEKIIRNDQISQKG